MVKAVADEIDSDFYLMFPTPPEDVEETRIFAQQNYYVKFISVFERPLIEGDYQDIVLYQEDFGEDVDSQKKYQNHETLLLNFYSFLYDHTKIYGRMWLSDREYHVEFDSKEEYLSHVLLSIREKVFLKIVLPEYKALIEGMFDFTMCLIVKKDYAQELEEIIKVVYQNNLYILEGRNEHDESTI